jgi:translation initiation factor 2B subunit (eIF-2B alpha/beta/delta family)
VESTFTQAIESIAADSHSGAAQIAERAADILLRRATSGEPASPDAFRRELLATGWALIHAQTAMAPLVNLVNSVLWKVESEDTPRDLRLAVGQATDEFKHMLRQHALRVAEGALGLIGEGYTIVTLSNSSTVQHALIHAQRAGRRMEVICAESRPSLEGREQAALLMNCGLSVTLLDDAAAIAAAARADLALVGADMLTNRGLVNKIGTRPMALAAREAGVPFYTLCGSEKFLPPGFRPQQQPDLPVADVWSDAADNAGGVSRFFDFTPLELLSGIVTEQGILPVAAVEAWLAATKLHPALADYANGDTREHVAVP